MRSVNKVILLGNLGKDPELRYTTSGRAVASFSVATSEQWNDGEGQEKTTWHNVVAWGKLAEICGEYLKKGSKAYFEGKIQNRTYDDKNGVKRYVSEVVIDDLVMLDSRQSTEAPTQRRQSPAPPDQGVENDLPF